MSYGLVDDCAWFELYVSYWIFPMVFSVSRKREGTLLSGLQYVHDLLMVGGVSDRSTDSSK